LEKAREGALYALRQGQVLAGFKCTVKSLLINPFDARFIRELLQVIRSQVQLRNARQWARPPV
jgi:hypothetical protein